MTFIKNFITLSLNLLTGICIINAMETPVNQDLIRYEKISVPLSSLPSNREIEKLKQFLIEGFDKDTANFHYSKEHLNSAILALNEYSSFIDKYHKYDFTKKNVKVYSDYNTSLANFAEIVQIFYLSFNNWIGFEAKKTYQGIYGEVMIQSDVREAYGKYGNYFDIFQNLTNAFFHIRQKISSVQKLSEIEIISTQNKSHIFGAFIEEKGYVAFPIVPNLECWTVSIIYGLQQFPQKYFVFSYGNLVNDAGLIINPVGTDIDTKSIKLTGYHGKAIGHPYTSHRITVRKALDNKNDLFLQSMIYILGETQIKTQTNFLPLPATVEDQNLLELLFLEDLLNDKKTSPDFLSSPAHKFLTWIESEEGAGLPVEEICPLLEEQLVAGYEATISQEAKSLELPKETKNKKQSRRGKNSKFKKQANNKKTAEDTSLRDSQQARELFAKVKQEGRVKFKKILGIINRIRSSAGNESIYQNFVKVSTRGSHTTFHLSEGTGLTLVKKHGKADSTVAAGIVNWFSLKLINVLLANSDS